jgi:transcriptional regulator with GAF, ATPase, and Fis domain
MDRRPGQDEVRITDPLPSETDLLRFDEQTGVLSVRRYELSVASGPDAGLHGPLEGRTVVGTQEGLKFRLTDTAVSRQHLELEPRADGVRVRDLDSRNGTFLLGHRVEQMVLDSDAVLSVGRSTLRVRAMDERIDPAKPAAALADVAGESTAMRALLGLLQRVARTRSPVLLLGETGTGKGLLARALHRASGRASKPFVVFDCSAASPTLVESELFGHARGAFTGAATERKGVFLEAHGGTAFLDEIGELPPGLQPKLLRVLEEGEVKPLGEDRPRRVDCRIIAATHRDLDADVRAGRFRQDLYYRLAVIVARVPPLRERLEDIPVLVRQLLSQLGRDPDGVPAEVLERWKAERWPGNVRELRNAIERELVGGAAAAIASKDLPAASDERGRIVAALERCAGNQTLAARELGISRRTLLNRLDALAIPRPRKR